MLVLGLGLGLRTYGIGLVIKALALTSGPRLRPGQTQCHRFIIARINADEFDPDLFTVSTVFIQ